jgi:hypothetical protein
MLQENSLQTHLPHRRNRILGFWPQNIRNSDAPKNLPCASDVASDVPSAPFTRRGQAPRHPVLYEQRQTAHKDFLGSVITVRRR